MSTPLYWKDFKEEESCDNCPLLKAELCTGNFTCYGNEPVEPPCCSFEDDTDLNAIVTKHYNYNKQKKNKQFKTALRSYCHYELHNLKEVEKKLKIKKEEAKIANSLSYIHKLKGEMQLHEEQVKIYQRLLGEIHELQKQVYEATNKYMDRKITFLFLYEQGVEVCGVKKEKEGDI